MAASLKFILALFAFLCAVSVESFVTPPSTRTGLSSGAASVGLWGTATSEDLRRPTEQRRMEMGSTSERRRARSRDGGTTVLEPGTERKQRTEKDAKTKPSPGNSSWEVRIYNDGFNTREHVARSLVQITGLSEDMAYRTMMKAHQSGIAVVGRWVYEIAEMYRDQLRNQGIVCDLNPVEEDSSSK
eukprot:CAMPEP_0194027542 /NCGR_PEP_ID=MMETSP0009_2-20130614/1686_1 /TAXON_ID=210454 /ORGANISM="Grammatophora oceanica, Strain CCMP 410" /LENGTH=185 /DNA_ID=CAMNT_0038666651 /DNA_START=163 /DNA_END=720 /DNA_ORIENTATION=+